MSPQFTAAEMQAYMAEIFPELGARYRVLEVGPFRLTARTQVGRRCSHWPTAPSTWRRWR